MYQPLNGRVYKAILRKKCPYVELSWSAFSCIQVEYGEIQNISPYSVRMRENADQNNSKYGHFSRSASKIKTGIQREFLQKFWHISFVCKKPLLRGNAATNTCIQGKLAEVYFGFKKFEEIIHIYQEARDEVDNGFSHFMSKLLLWLKGLYKS